MYTLFLRKYISGVLKLFLIKYKYKKIENKIHVFKNKKHPNTHQLGINYFFAFHFAYLFIPDKIPKLMLNTVKKFHLTKAKEK